MTSFIWHESAVMESPPWRMTVENDSRESFGDSERERKVTPIKKPHHDIDFMA